MKALIVVDYSELTQLLAPQRAQGKTIALANGCFDVLHVGHVRMLADARREADLLVVALNSDASVRENKGAERPYQPLAERMEIIAALASVDYVTSYDDATAGPLIDRLQPEVQIKGTDRSPDSVPERAQIEKYGGRIAICGDPKTHSSSELISGLRRED